MCDRLCEVNAGDAVGSAQGDSAGVPGYRGEFRRRKRPEQWGGGGAVAAKHKQAVFELIIQRVNNANRVRRIFRCCMTATS